MLTKDWKGLASSIEPRTQLFIDGEFRDAMSGRTELMINPATGQPSWSVAWAGIADVDSAVDVARRAYGSGAWSDAAPAERKRVLLRLADLLHRSTEEMACTITLEMGKPIGYAVREVGSTERALRFYAEAIDKVYGEIAPVAPPTLALVTREPIGVVAAILPWNYPLQIAMWKVAPALATGNSLIVKPSEQSPLSALLLAELATEAGVPPGVINVLSGEGQEVGKALGLHRGVDQIAFTGSAEVGRKLLRYASESNLKRVALELGGKSPTVIFEDAPELKTVAAITADAIFMNAGQMCNAGSRVLVQRERKAEFLDHFEKTMVRWHPGDPLETDTLMGPLIDGDQRDRVLAYIEIGKEEGASVALRSDADLPEGNGFYVAPTVFSDVRNDMRIACEEIFGPVLSVIEFDTEEEGIALANDTGYGLAAGVWTSDLKKGHRVARKLQAGTIYVNNWDYADYSVPFGGYKESGIGRDKSLHGFDHYTQIKSTFVALDPKPRTILEPADLDHWE